MDLPGGHSLSHNILGFSRPVGLGRNSSTSQDVFVELYSVAHRVKEKGICVCQKWNYWVWVLKQNLLQRLCHTPQGTMLYLSLPKRRTTWSDDQSVVVPTSGVWSGYLRRPRRWGLWTASLSFSFLLLRRLISGLEILSDRWRPLSGQAFTEGGPGQLSVPFSLVRLVPYGTNTKSKHRHVWWCRETSL